MKITPEFPALDCA